MTKILAVVHPSEAARGKAPELAAQVIDLEKRVTAVLLSGAELDSGDVRITELIRSGTTDLKPGFPPRAPRRSRKICSPFRHRPRSQGPCAAGVRAGQGSLWLPRHYQKNLECVFEHLKGDGPDLSHVESGGRPRP